MDDFDLFTISAIAGTLSEYRSPCPDVTEENARARKRLRQLAREERQREAMRLLVESRARRQARQEARWERHWRRSYWARVFSWHPPQP